MIPMNAAVLQKSAVWVVALAVLSRTGSAFTTAPLSSAVRPRSLVQEAAIARPLNVLQAVESNYYNSADWEEDHDRKDDSNSLPVLDAEVLDFVRHEEKPLVKTNKASTDPTPVVFAAVQNLLKQNFSNEAGTKNLFNTSMFAVAALALILSLTPLSASAAMSGGRMGGSFSSPRPSMSRPAPSSSYSRGYSGGYSSGMSSGYYSRPSFGGYAPIAPIAPIVPISPFYAPRPFFFGGGGPSVITYNRGPSLFDVLLFGGLGFFLLSAVRGLTSNNNMSSAASVPWSTDTAVSALGPGTGVVQVSVALQVPDRHDRSSILSVLDRLAQTGRTDSRSGIQQLTSQVALELLRRKSSIVSAATKYQHFRSREQAQREFTNVSVQERAKFEHETVSQYGGVDYSSSRRMNAGTGGGGASSSSATVAVVTLVLAIDGDSTKIPKITSMQDVEAALSKIAANSKVDDCLQAAEILWTPEDPSESLSLRDVLADYPELRSL